MNPDRTDDRSLDDAMVLAGILALLIAEREDRLGDEPMRRTEVVLADAGISMGQIARLTGKKYETVKTTLRRARSKGDR